MLEEQRRLLATRGGSEADLLQMDALRGGVLARSGNTGDALQVFVEPWPPTGFPRRTIR